MGHALHQTTGSTVASAYLEVSCLPDGRYAVVYTAGVVRRCSYTPSAEQVVRQAQRAGNLPIRTNDETLRQHCQAVELPLLEAGTGDV